MKKAAPVVRCLVPSLLALACAQVLAADVDQGLREHAVADGGVDVLIVLAAKPSKQLLRSEGDVRERRRALVELLRANAEVSQAPVLRWLSERGIAHRPYWVVNSISARLTPTQLDELSGLAAVSRIASNASVAADLPVADSADPNAVVPHAPFATTWGVNKIRAPEVWAAGFKGQGVVVAGQDTGYLWSHEALKAKYRGWNGTTANHGYSWHDAIHAGGGVCGANTAAPCDDQGHGTHTMGTIVGDGGGNQIGVAPDARWIGCRNMNVGDGTPATYIECTQWFIAPTDAAGNNPDPDMAPDVVNNSWGCPVSEGCTTGQEIREAIENIVEAGIFFVAAAGNDGSGCGTINSAPATYDIAFTVGATTATGTMSSFSSRGPVAGVIANKPDITAPGSNIYSSLYSGLGAYDYKNGTSMASPHVAGAAALLMSVNPGLKGDPARVAEILRSTAVPLTTTTQVCGGIPSTTFPNPVQGRGQIDVYAAFLAAEKITANGFDSGN